MNTKTFKKKYPELSRRLSEDFYSEADEEHIVKKNIEEGRDGLDLWSKLVQLTPSEEIHKSYDGDLDNQNKFYSFVSEMWGYIAAEKWLCNNVSVADIPCTSGLPDFECEQIDLDATRLFESQEKYRIRNKLKKIFDEQPYYAHIMLKREYDKQAVGHERWAENEEHVNQILEKLEKIDRENPETVETDAIRVEFERKSNGPFTFGGFGWSKFGSLVTDEEDKIPRVVRDKADQARDGRPLVVFIDCKLTSVDCIEEVVRSLIGEPVPKHGRETQVSEEIDAVRSTWEDYLNEIGAVPEDGISAIPPEKEGVFVEEELEGIAGVMIRLKGREEVGYIPNIYTKKVNARQVYDRLGWGQETHSLTYSDI